MATTTQGKGSRSLRDEARLAKSRIKSGFWTECQEDMDEHLEKAREQGYVTTEFGRKRYIPELSASNKNVQHFGERVAMNSPIQGTAADIIKIAMIKVSEQLALSGIDARLILQVHDELILEAHKDCAERASFILREQMENVASLSVPLTVDLNVGSSWYDCK